MYNVHKTGTAYDIYNLTALDFFYQKPNKTTDNLKKYNYICTVIYHNYDKLLLY